MTAVLYLIMRNDLPSLNPGKLAAQAAHCANAAVAAARRSKSRALRGLLKEWERQSKQDFGTTIVLAAPRFFIEHDMPSSSHVYDDTYPCEIAPEIGAYLQLHAHKYSQPQWAVDARPHDDGFRWMFLRRELVGAFEFAANKPEKLRMLELYP